jgi:hypothetical protein
VDIIDKMVGLFNQAEKSQDVAAARKMDIVDRVVSLFNQAEKIQNVRATRKRSAPTTSSGDSVLAPSDIPDAKRLTLSIPPRR